MAKVTITYELCPYQDRSEIRSLIKYSDYRAVLWEIDQHIRSTLKHSDEEWLNTPAYEYLEKLREMIHESGVFLDEW